MLGINCVHLARDRTCTGMQATIDRDKGQETETDTARGTTEPTTHRHDTDTRAGVREDEDQKVSKGVHICDCFHPPEFSSGAMKNCANRSNAPCVQHRVSVQCWCQYQCRCWT